MKMSIGLTRICSFDLKEGWKTLELYENILKIKDQDAFDENGPKLKNYKTFYLKIFGYYDEEIVKHFRKCECCPNNPSYYRFTNYNELLNKKQPVLVLRSKYFDFREYEIYCSYYSDERINETNKSYIEIRADKKTIINKTIEVFLRLIKRLTSF